MSVASLVDLELACRLWRVSRADFIYFLVACLGTLMLSVEAGLLLALAISITWTIYRSSFASKAETNRLSTTSLNPESLEIRIESPITFLNSEDVLAKIESAFKEAVATRKAFLVVNLSSVAFVDASGIEVLEEAVILSAKHGIVFHRMSSRVDFAMEGVAFRNLVEAANGSILDSHVCDLEE